MLMSPLAFEERRYGDICTTKEGRCLEVEELELQKGAVFPPC